ncbi:DUF2789 family protein [Aliiglaciecola sp. CAU 1673]|uniref:DUF2789 family protein n=1 Tax=Aliiglaciecola sp. CAU 1673 TaxID=3032595 RepID=UPI0023DBD726|nr:DUF2789 family protein [Aliiglaciecola sp. CAU 1673]MDF2179636.1 DUF2789 family protein [Aliiglaciecola sp. CAU 1673]
MNLNAPTISDLFEQLGLDNDEKSINQFIERYRGLDSETKLEQAAFWNNAQSSFIKSALTEDAEWAEVIDQLNMRLR